MAAVGEFLLFDERVFLQPVEQLRAVGADDAGLGIMDVRVDEAGHDELALVVVDRGAWRSARQDFARLAHRGDFAVLDSDGAVLDQPMRARAHQPRVVAKAQDAAANDAGGPVHGRMSFSRSAAIELISASAAANSLGRS